MPALSSVRGLSRSLDLPPSAQILGAVTAASSPGLRFLPAQQPPARYRDLTLRCLSYDPAARPTFADVCEELRLISLEEATAALKRVGPQPAVVEGGAGATVNAEAGAAELAAAAVSGPQQAVAEA